MDRNWERDNEDFTRSRGRSRQPGRRALPNPNSGYEQERPDEPDRLVWQPITPQDELIGAELDGLERPSGNRLRVSVVLVMVISAVFVGWAYRAPICAFLSAIGDIGAPGATTELRTQGLAAAGFVGVVIVAVVRILKN